MQVYLITNLVNEKVYVGQTKFSFSRRWATHCYEALKGSRLFLHKAIRKYGVESFSGQVLTDCGTEEELDNFEKVFIIVFRSANPRFGYNQTLGGRRGIHTAEVRVRMSELKRGKKLPESTRRNQSLARKASPIVKEHLRKLAELNRGRKYSELTKAKISATQKGRKRSDEHRFHISFAKTFARELRIRLGFTPRRLSESHKRELSSSMSFCKTFAKELRCRLVF